MRAIKKKKKENETILRSKGKDVASVLMSANKEGGAASVSVNHCKEGGVTCVLIFRMNFTHFSRE